MEKSERSDRVESFGEIDLTTNCPRARLGFIKPIRNGMRKKQNLIGSRLSMAETDLAGKENEVRLQKKEWSK